MSRHPFDHSRADWYEESAGFRADVVQRSNLSLRPPLRLPLDVFGVHYAGAGRSWLDVGDTVRELVAVESFSRSEGKPNQYNSVSDISSETWEYAGPFQAAHSSGNNSTVWGHLCLYGLEELSDRQAEQLIAGIRRARQQLVDVGWLTPGHTVLPHQLLRGARTGCPGPLYTVGRWWDAIAAPLNPQPPIEPNPLPDIEIGDPDMEALVLWKDRRYAEVFLVGAGPAINVSPDLRDHYRSLGVPQLVDQHDGLLASCKHQAGLVRLTPVGGS
ncbi:MAG: hypothetical protein AAGG08_10760 [Actinomycetota bacterium]